MIITCPNCQTRYRVASDALSAAGRQVQCATCAQMWMATPSFPPPPDPFDDPDPDDDELGFRADDDTLFGEADETMLDAAFIAEEERENGPPEPPGDPPIVRKRSGEGDGVLVRARMDELARRRNAAIRKLPMARFRRAARVVLVLIMVISVAAGIWLRTDIVRNYPEMDAFYRLLGLGTNVIGLQIGDLNILRTTRDGNPVILVHAEVSNTTAGLVPVPNVLVSLLGMDRQVIYEWSVTPSVRSILPGDVLSIDTQLTSPPAGVETVRLSFVEGSAP
ncbi:MJ0042-type zinc finger domain-containing protein [Pelagibacterium sediminicola]|uniref:MJ0042-type zinc finger domain-containing protein n=1 Tax=Pelagibacterium sediminicola TaxID=2248761 RepID=UPI0013002137|nr:MJ0042-type zinc finger domain-containing protein [Pelagibacterium sediminicola]